MGHFDDNLLTFSTSLTSDHLSLSLEAYYRLDTEDKRIKNALSCILHSFCGLEAAVNLIGFELYFNPDSSLFIPENKRDLPLKKLLRSWNASLPCLEKIELVMAYYSENIDEKLRNELTELNNLRNWISHGLPYQTTWLIQPDENDNSKGIVLDYEYSVDWKKKFPVTKFNSLDELSGEDAEKALRIVLRTLIKLATATKQIFHLVTYTGKVSYKLIHNDVTVEDILSR